MLLMTFDEMMSNDYLLEYVKGNPSYLGREYDDRLKNVLESKISSALVSRHALRDLLHISRDTLLAVLRTMCVRHVNLSSD